MSSYIKDPIQEAKDCSFHVCLQSNPQPLSNFYKDSSSKDKLSYYCKSCCKLKAKWWQKSNRAKRQIIEARYKNSHVTWNDRNKEKIMNYKNPYRKFKKHYCEQCGFKALDPCQLDVDHVDGNHKNNEISNLQTLCANCHRLKTKMNRDGKRGKYYAAA